MTSMPRSEAETTGRTVWMLAIAGLVSVALYAVVGLLSRPLADDLCMAAAANRLGIVGGVHHYYWTWTGNVITLYYQIIGGALWAYAVNPAILLALWLAGFCWLSWETFSWLGLAYRRPLALLSGCLLTLAVNDASPNLFQTLYWLTGTSAYALPSALTVWLAATGIRTGRLGFVRVHGISALLFAFVIGNSSPTNSAFVLGLLLLALFVTLLFRRSLNWRALRSFYACAIVGAAVAGALILLSPGNAIRQDALVAYGVMRQPILNAVIFAALFTIGMLWMTLAAAPLSIAALLMIGYIAGLLFRPNGLARARLAPKWTRRAVAGALITSFLIYYGANFPVALTTGIPPAPRIWVVPQSVWVVVVMAAGYAAALGVSPGLRPATRHRAGMIAVAAVALLIGSQLIDALDDAGPLNAYRGDLETRMAYVAEAQAAGANAVLVPPAQFDIASYAELGAEFNLDCMRQYFELESLAFADAGTD